MSMHSILEVSVRPITIKYISKNGPLCFDYADYFVQGLNDRNNLRTSELIWINFIVAYRKIQQIRNNPGTGKTSWLDYAVTHFKIHAKKANLAENITRPGDCPDQKFLFDSICVIEIF